MKKILAFAITMFSLGTTDANVISCKYSDPTSQCPENYYCSKLSADEDVCLRYPDKIPTITLPFAKDTKIKCYKSEVLGEVTSHSDDQSRFAADIYTEDFSNGSLFAVFSGTAYVHTGCSAFDEGCGSGYGNTVKIIGDNGYVAFYAHLSKVKVKSGQYVKTGQFIGMEGATGATGVEPRTSMNGFKHLHLSIHKYQSWGRRYNDSPFPAFGSIPFRLKIIHNDRKQVVDVRKLPCHYPYLTGDQSFISDWL